MIRVRAASVNAPDWRLLRGRPYMLRLLFGIRKPRFKPGSDVAGDVEAVGHAVQHFKPGDAVFGVCRGAFAQYAATAEMRVILKPPKLTYEEAACVPVAALTALQGLRDKGRLRAGSEC